MKFHENPSSGSEGGRVSSFHVGLVPFFKAEIDLFFRKLKQFKCHKQQFFFNFICGTSWKEFRYKSAQV